MHNMTIDEMPKKEYEELKSAIANYDKEKILEIRDTYGISMEDLNFFSNKVYKESNSFDIDKYENVAKIFFPEFEKYEDDIYWVYTWLCKAGLVSMEEYLKKINEVENFNDLREKVRKEIGMFMLYQAVNNLDTEKIEKYLKMTKGEYYGEKIDI